MGGIKSKKVFWGLVGVIGFHLVANLIWLWWDKTPPAWDQAAHLRISVLWAQALGGSGQKVIDIIRQAYGYPPLITFMGGLWAAVVGVGIKQITWVNSWFLVGLLVGLFALAREILASEKKALVAVALVSFFPVVYDISRNMLLDLPLTVWFVWGLYFWKQSEYLSRLKGTIGWGIMVILASLTKLNGFIYFAPMVLISVWQAVKFKKQEIWLNLMVAGAMYLVGVGWWWLLNSQNIYSYLTGLAGAGEKLTDPMNLGEWQTWIHYLRLMFLHQLSPVGVILMMVALAKINKEKWKKWSYWVVIVGLNYVIFTVIKNKDFRFTLPLLPLLAIGWAQGIWGMGKVWQVATWGYLGWMFINNSFGWPVAKPWVVSTPTFLAGDVEWIGIDDYPVKSPKKSSWPQTQIIEDISYHSIEDQKREKVLVLINIEELNDNNLFLARELAGAESLADFGSVGMQR